MVLVVGVDKVIKADGLVGHIRVALMELIVQEALVMSERNLVKLDVAMPNVHAFHLIKR